MASVTIVSDEVAAGFSLKHYDTTAPARVYVRDDSFSVMVIDTKDGDKRYAFEYILYDDKMVLRRRIDGFYDGNILPDIVIWQK